MRKILFILILIFGIILNADRTLYAQEASIVRATEVNGTVTRNGAPLKEGDIIERDDKIECQDKSSVVLSWTNGSILEVYPNTSIIFKGIVFESDKKLEKSLLALKKGRVFVKAQVPEHIFCHFEINAGNIPIMAQGAEYALKYDENEKKISVYSLIGRVVADVDIHRVRIDEGQQIILKSGIKPDTPVLALEKTRKSLMETSKRLGGSLLIEEETGSDSGPLRVKIGGVRNRRGNVPYTVRFKANIKGGNGKIKSIKWNFGDGESSAEKEVEHTFTQGIYVVIIRVEDENGEKVTAQINISVEEDCAC